MGNAQRDKERLIGKFQGKIEVSYDGSYPNACSGRLIISAGGTEIYNKDHCCSSNGSCSFDSDWNAIVEDGLLVWDDADEFSERIQRKVEDVLGEVYVCCGGCL